MWLWPKLKKATFNDIHLIDSNCVLYVLKQYKAQECTIQTFHPSRLRLYSFSLTTHILLVPWTLFQQHRPYRLYAPKPIITSSFAKLSFPKSSYDLFLSIAPYFRSFMKCEDNKNGSPVFLSEIGHDVDVQDDEINLIIKKSSVTPCFSDKPVVTSLRRIPVALTLGRGYVKYYKTSQRWSWLLQVI